MLGHMRKHTKSIMIAVIIFFVLSCFAGYGLYARSGGGDGERDYAVAKVNGRKVMRSAVDSAMLRIAEQMASGDLSAEDWLLFRQAALDSFAVQSELEKEIKSRKLDVTKEEIESAYVSVMDSYPTREAFQQFIERSGVKEQAIKDDIRNQMQRERVIQALISEIEVSDEEAQQFYEVTKSFLFKREAGYMINIASFSTKATAQKAQSAIAGGTSWDAVLEENKAELLTSTPFDKPSEMAESVMQGNLEIIKNARINQVTPVIEITADEFAIVLKRSKTEARTLPFAEVKQDAANMIRNQKTESIFINLRARAKVEVLDTAIFPSAPAPNAQQQPASEDKQP